MLQHDHDYFFSLQPPAKGYQEADDEFRLHAHADTDM